MGSCEHCNNLWILYKAGNFMSTWVAMSISKAEPTYIPVMLFLNKMVAGPERNEVCIVCRRRYGNRSCAPHIRVTQLIREALEFIRVKMVVIPEDVVVTRSTCSLKLRTGWLWAWQTHHLLPYAQYSMSHKMKGSIHNTGFMWIHVDQNRASGWLLWIQ